MECNSDRLRVLCLSKRRYMRRDLLSDRYGRMWRLPECLAASGAVVEGICTAYKEAADNTENLHQTYETGGELRWRSRLTRFHSPLAWRALFREALAAVDGLRPDLVCAFSDAFHVVLGARVAAQSGIPFAADFYDNYEAYGATRLPGVRGALRKAAAGADLVTCVSRPLADFIEGEYGVSGRVEVLENGIEPMFRSDLDKTVARRRLGLPAEGRIAGTAGALSASRGIGNLFEAFERLAGEMPDLHLALAGEPERPLPRHPRIHALGELDHAEMPGFYRALDVGVVCVKDDAFGQYCFPQKAAEMAAAGLPMVFPAIGVMATPEADTWGHRVPTARPDALADGLRSQLRRPTPPTWQPATWRELSSRWQSQLDNIRAMQTGRRGEALGP